MTINLKPYLIRIAQLLQGKNGYDEFAEAIRERESNGDYGSVNSLGYLGAYQFGMARLADFGLTERIPGTTGSDNIYFRWKDDCNKEKFLGSPAVQDNIFFRHCQNLAQKINSVLNPYLGKTIGSVPITLSGLIAGAHLGGLGADIDFITKGTNYKDAYGTSVGGYISDFEGYKLESLI